MCCTLLLGDSVFKQNKSLLPKDQMVTCEPRMKTVSVTEFYYESHLLFMYCDMIEYDLVGRWRLLRILNFLL